MTTQPKAIFKGKIITKTRQGFAVGGKTYLTLGKATASITAKETK